MKIKVRKTWSQVAKVAVGKATLFRVSKSKKGGKSISSSKDADETEVTEQEEETFHQSSWSVASGPVTLDPEDDRSEEEPTPTCKVEEVPSRRPSGGPISPNPNRRKLLLPANSWTSKEDLSVSSDLEISWIRHFEDTCELEEEANIDKNDSGKKFVSPSASLPVPEGGACYLVYEPDSSGRLIECYSKVPIPNAVGRWTPGPEKKIAAFKFKQNVGRSLLIGGCSGGVQGRKNYFSGWCQYVRSAKLMNAKVMLWDPVGKGLKVDVYLYTSATTPKDQTIKLVSCVETPTDNVRAVACIPKTTEFYEGMTVDIIKWLADGTSHGASSLFT